MDEGGVESTLHLRKSCKLKVGYRYKPRFAQDRQINAGNKYFIRYWMLTIFWESGVAVQMHKNGLNDKEFGCKDTNKVTEPFASGRLGIKLPNIINH